MPAGITKAHIDAELRKLIRTAELLGIKDKSELWQVNRGSVAQNRPWRLLVWSRRDGQTNVDFLPDSIIGANARETLNNLRTFNLAWSYFLKKGK